MSFELSSVFSHHNEAVHFSDIQLMERQEQSQESEEVILRPKLLKQQNTEETPPHSPRRGILKNGGLTMSRAGIASPESIELPNADGKFNDNNVSPSISGSRRRSVFVRLKTFVMRSLSNDSEIDGKLDLLRCDGEN